MNLEKVIFGFFVILACTLNFGFFIGDITVELHHPAHLFAAVVINRIALVMKFGDRTHWRYRSGDQPGGDAAVAVGGVRLDVAAQYQPFADEHRNHVNDRFFERWRFGRQSD